MNNAFLCAFHCERLKKRHSLASWLIVVGGFFTPAIIIGARLFNYDRLQASYSADGFWMQHWRMCWESMAIFFLPMGAILATSLITQLEYKNNAWKQVHTLPLTITTIFFSKLLVIVLMMVQFFLLFNIGIYLAMLVPYLVVSGVEYPRAPLPLVHFVWENALFFVDTLPIVALQYLISLRFKNFMIPIGAGFLMWVTALGMLSWKFSYVLPYTYCMFNFLKDHPNNRAAVPDVNIHVLAIGYFLVFTAAGYVLFVTKKERG